KSSNLRETVMSAPTSGGSTRGAPPARGDPPRRRRGPPSRRGNCGHGRPKSVGIGRKLCGEVPDRRAGRTPVGRAQSLNEESAEKLLLARAEDAEKDREGAERGSRGAAEPRRAGASGSVALRRFRGEGRD